HDANPDPPSFPTRRSSDLIGIDQTIKTEVIVVGIVAVVAAEFIPDIAVVVLCLDPVVAPLPDIMTLNAIVLIEDVLVLRQPARRSEEHTSELQSRFDLVCR